MSYLLIKDAFVDNRLINKKLKEYRDGFNRIDSIENIIADIKSVKIDSKTKTLIYIFNGGIIGVKSQKEVDGEIELKTIISWYKNNDVTITEIKKEA